MRVRFHPAAQFEVANARDAFAERDPTSVARFERRLDRALRRLQEFPALGKPGAVGTRSLYLAPFPYHLVYLPHDNEILVLAIAHAAQKPGYWRDRARGRSF